jgi:hypothetical protein
MDGLGITQDVERQIEEVMTDLGLTRDEALIVLGHASGYALGNSDIVCIHSLTAEQWRRLGLGRDFREVLAEQRAREAREAGQEAAPPNGHDAQGTPAADDRAGASDASRSHGVSPRRDPA